VSLLFKPLYRVYRLVSWWWHWVQRRFTVAGLLALGTLLLTGLSSPDLDNNMAYQVFALLLVMLAASLCFSGFFRARFSATRVLPRFGTAGCPLHYAVRLKNQGKKPQAGLTVSEALADSRPSYKEWLAEQKAEQRRARSFRFSQRWWVDPFKVAVLNEMRVPSVPPQQEVAVSCELMPLRRGALKFAGLTLARPDPLGLVQALDRVPLPQVVLILPKRYPLPPIAMPGVMKYQRGGVALASSVGQSEEFVALRDYRHGDPLRRIHWRSWAKASKPVVKEFEDENFVRHALVLDTFTDEPRGEAFEEAVSIAASFACALQTQESLLDLLFVGPDSYCFTAGRGLAQADRMLEILASVGPCNERPFKALEHLVLGHVQIVSGCVCIFLTWNEERQEFVRRLKLLGVPLLVLVVVGPGEKKNLDPGPMHDEPEQFRVLECGRVEQGLAALK
jgi:uncharacterized protein (DUF58 family)